MCIARDKTLSVVFKSNFQHQEMLLPPDLNELIASDHPVRVVNEVLEKIGFNQLIRQYKPGGTSSYYPRLQLKILVYAYINNVYSSKEIEEAISQNIYYMGQVVIGNNNYRVFRSQECRTFGNKSTEKLATRSAELFLFRVHPDSERRTFVG